jgi:ABC-type multidrug transport system permease subunit
MKREPSAKDGIGSCLLVVGIGLGLLTGLAFLLLLGAAVGIGMGGGLKNPQIVMSGFIIAASVTVICVVAGISFKISSKNDAKRAGSTKEREHS